MTNEIKESTPVPAGSQSLRSKVLSGLFWSSLQNWGTRIMTLVVFAVFARVLSPEDLGVFAAAMAVLAFVQMFSEQGLADAIVQRREVTPPLLNAAAAINLVLAIVVMTALLFAAPYVSQRMNAPGLTDVLRFCAVNLVIMALGFSQQAMQRRVFNYRWLAACSFASTFVSGAVGIGGALLGYGVWSLVAQSIVAAVINTAMLWLRPQWHFSWNFDLKGVRSLLGFGVQRLASNFLEFANSRYIEIYIAMAFGAAALGVYAVGSKIYQALMQVMGSVVFGVALGGFSRLAHDRAALLSAYYRSMTSTAVLAVPIFCFVSALAPEIVFILFGERWADSAIILQYVSVIGALQVLQFQNGVVFNAIGKPSLALGFLIFRTVVTFSALWLSGSAELNKTIAYFAFSQAIVFFPNFILAKYVFNVSIVFLVRRVWPFVLGGVLAMTSINFARDVFEIYFESIYLQAISLLIVGVGVYVVFSCVAGREALVEIRQILRRQRA